MWLENLPPTLVFIKEINTTMEAFLYPKGNPTYQANANYRDKEFQKDVHLDP